MNCEVCSSFKVFWFFHRNIKKCYEVETLHTMTFFTISSRWFHYLRKASLGICFAHWEITDGSGETQHSALFEMSHPQILIFHIHDIITVHFTQLTISLNGCRSMQVKKCFSCCVIINYQKMFLTIFAAKNFLHRIVLPLVLCNHNNGPRLLSPVPR